MRLLSSVIIALSYTSSIIKGDDKDTTASISSRRLQLLSQICVADDSDDVTTVIRKLIQTGRTSKARLLGNECLLMLYNKISAPQFSSLLKCCSGGSDIIVETYKTSKAKLYEKEDYLQTVIDNLKKNADTTTQPSFSDKKCEHSEAVTVEIDVMPFASNNGVVTTHGSNFIEQWNACCSHWRDLSASKCIDNEFCCELVEGTDHHLILPALREPKLQIRLEKSTEVIEIEQDGLLQLYDVSGVLWPAGYLLGLCLSDPVKCGAEEIFGAISNVTQPFGLELGSGVGFASISLSKTMSLYANAHTVIATDISKSALDLTVTNAYQNGVGEMIVAMEADYRDKGSMMEVKNTIDLLRGNTSKQVQQGFDIIIGSSLQSLFDGTQNCNAPLWLTLDTLLSKSNPSSTVILSHIRSGSERIQVPDETIPFELVRRIAGDHFNMKTRDGNNSDFELVILRRRRQFCSSC